MITNQDDSRDGCTSLYPTLTSCKPYNKSACQPNQATLLYSLKKKKDTLFYIVLTFFSFGPTQKCHAMTLSALSVSLGTQGKQTWRKKKQKTKKTLPFQSTVFLALPCSTLTHTFMKAFYVLLGASCACFTKACSEGVASNKQKRGGQRFRSASCRAHTKVSACLLQLSFSVSLSN